MINNIEELKSKLFSCKIIYSNFEMKGCSELEVLELESRYGKLPSSYRQIIKTIGPGTRDLQEDTSTHFYIFSTAKTFDNSILITNEEFETDRKELLENKEGDLIHPDFYTIPEHIFIIESWDGNDWYIPTDTREQKEDSPVYLYRDSGAVKKVFSSVWEWIEHVIERNKY